MRRIAFIVGILLFTTSVFAQKNLTLNEAISIALQNNSNLIKSKNRLTVNELSLKKAYSDLLPNLAVSGSWGWNRTSTSEKTYSVTSPYTGADSNYTVPSGDADSRSWGVSAGGNVTLFNGLANYANISASKSELEAAKYNLEKVKQDIIYTTTELFYAILQAKELMKVRQDNVEYNQKLLETIEEKNKLGSVAIADVYAQKVQLGTAQKSLIVAENTYETTKLSLLSFLALDVFDEYAMVDPFGEITKDETSKLVSEFGSVDNMVNTAFNTRYDYKSTKHSLKAYESYLTQANGGLFPTLSGNYSFGTSAADPGDLFETRNYGIGLSISYPIFNNWSTSLQIQSAKVNQMNAIEDVEILKRDIKIEVKQGYLDLVAAQKEVEVSLENVISARENRKINNERYSLGSGTILDVLQADRDYQQALLGRIQAEYEFYRLRDNLLNALGKLDSKLYE